MPSNQTTPHSQDLAQIIGESKGCHRIIWNYLIHASQGEIKVEKRIAIWIRHKEGYGALWKRHLNLTIPLEWFNCFYDEKGNLNRLSKTTNKYLTVVGDAIEFNGGYLEVKDPGLIEPLDALGLPLKQVADSMHESECEPYTYEPKTLIGWFLEKYNGELPEEFSSSELDWATRGNIPQEKLKKPFEDDNANSIRQLQPVGRNIHVEAEFEGVSLQKFQPLFYFPQNDNGQSHSKMGKIYLAIGPVGEVVNSRNVYWEISDQMFFLSAPYELEKANDRHVITVSQDSNWFPEEENQSNTMEERAYFEFLVDAIGLPSGLMIGKASPIIAKDIKRISPLRPNIDTQIGSSDSEFLKDKVIDHPFGLGERKFCVGYAPDDPHSVFSDWEVSDEERIFRGKIHRLFFDPNSSCAAC